MGYWGFMGYGVQIPVHRLGGSKKLWDIRGYGLPEAWVMRESTVAVQDKFHMSIEGFKFVNLFRLCLVQLGVPYCGTNSLQVICHTYSRL